MVPVTDKIWKKWNLGMGLKNLCLLTYILEVHVSRSLKLSTFYVFLKQASDPKRQRVHYPKEIIFALFVPF